MTLLTKHFFSDYLISSATKNKRFRETLGDAYWIDRRIQLMDFLRAKNCNAHIASAVIQRMKTKHLWHVSENWWQSVCAPISLTPMKSATLWIASWVHQKVNLPLLSQLDWAMLLAQTHCISSMHWVDTQFFGNEFLHFWSYMRDYHKWHNFGMPCPSHGHLRKRWFKRRISVLGNW